MIPRTRMSSAVFGLQIAVFGANALSRDIRRKVTSAMTHRTAEVGTTIRWFIVLGLGVAANRLLVDGAPPMAVAGQCIRDAAGFTQGNICSANDVTMTSLAVLGTCIGGSENGATCIRSHGTYQCGA